jgi:hypothetical protein
MTELSFTKTFLQGVDSKPIKLPYDYVVPPEDMRLPVPVSNCAHACEHKLSFQLYPFLSYSGYFSMLTRCEQYTLPRLSPPHPTMAKKIKTTVAPGSSKSISVQLKSSRNPVLEFSVDNVPLTTTTVHDLREAVRDRVVASDGNPPAGEKIKILYKKKPIGGSAEKTLAEILSDSEPDVLAGGKTVEFGVMIMGGASIKPEVTESPAGSAAKVTETEPLPSNPAQGPSGSQVLQTEEFWKDLEGYLELRTKDTVEALRLAGIFKRAWQADVAKS